MSTRIIPKHIVPMEPFCIWKEGFYLEDCEKIKQLGELFEFEQAKIGPERSGRIDENIRKTDITWINPIEDTYWIFDRMSELASKINFDKYQLDLDCFDGFQYSKYGINGHYSWHTDTSNEPINGRFRKLSFSLMLSDPSDYEGGELLIASSGNQDTPTIIKPNKGELVVFYSHLPHKVAPVTKGERCTLVTWGLGGKLK